MMAIGQVYGDLASEVDPDPNTLTFVPIRTPDAQLQDTLLALGRDYSVEGERFRATV